MPDRVILHSDLNNFYASAECILFPEFKNKPLAVCGDEKARHGIVLAKSEEAKKYGVRTGDVIWEAKRKCPHLVIRPARFSVYTKLSKEVRDIYGRFTDHIEPFGIDECWLDVTKSGVFGSGYEIAEQIRRAVREELGLSVSVGVSFNKVFAKLASDLKKPDAVSVVDRSNFREKIYGLPVTDLLFVGKSMAARLEKIGVRTIGALAAAEPAFLQSYLGKWGQTLSTYARGEDDSPVRHIEEAQELKSIGNSTTWREDILNLSDVKRVLYILSESVASRLKDAGLGKANTVHLWVRDRDLTTIPIRKKCVRPRFAARSRRKRTRFFANITLCGGRCAGWASPFRASIRAWNNSRSVFSRAITKKKPARSRQWKRSAANTATKSCSGASCSKIKPALPWI